MEISTILDQIDLGTMALPEFQRGYGWNRNQVRRFPLFYRFGGISGICRGEDFGLGSCSVSEKLA